MAMDHRHHHAGGLYVCISRRRTLCRLRHAGLLRLSCRLRSARMEVGKETRTRARGRHAYHAREAQSASPLSPALSRCLGTGLLDSHPLHQLHRARPRLLRQRAELHRTVVAGPEVCRAVAAMDHHRRRARRPLCL